MVVLNSGLLQREAQKELARRDLFQYCCMTAPDFYRPERTFLKTLCWDLQTFLASDDDVGIYNLPPRHGKSRTAGEAVKWIFGQDPTLKVMTGSYNETLSTTFAKNVRNAIQQRKADRNRFVFSDFFPGVRIKAGDAAMSLWSLEGGYNSYLATSPTGTATGFGANLIFIDDLIKLAEEANNEAVLEKHWRWFTDTMLSRLEAGGKVIIIMTRWHSQDLAGRALAEMPAMGYKVRHLSMKALQDDGTMLCPAILPRADYDKKTRIMGDDIAAANYQQEPIDLRGRLYSSFKTYTHLPKDAQGNVLFEQVRNYTDVADTGSDYLCSINYGVYQGEAYVLDVLYTKAPMEVTEPETARILHDDEVNVADIESNNGGRGFARAVERVLKEKYRSNHTVVQPFYQKKNKTSRITTQATWVMQHVYYPVNWRDRWPEYHKAMTRYQREGKNAHDDAPDCTTGIAEKLANGGRFGFD